MKSALDLIQVAKEDLSAECANEEDVMNRLHALMVALEYLNIVSYSVKEGTVRYLRELEVFRHEQPGLAFLVRADRLIRRKVAELQADQKDVPYVLCSSPGSAQQPQVLVERSQIIGDQCSGAAEEVLFPGAQA